jgi:hypothetical protein
LGKLSADVEGLVPMEMGELNSTWRPKFRGSDTSREIKSNDRSRLWLLKERFARTGKMVVAVCVGFEGWGRGLGACEGASPFFRDGRTKFRRGTLVGHQRRADLFTVSINLYWVTVKSEICADPQCRAPRGVAVRPVSYPQHALFAAQKTFLSPPTSPAKSCFSSCGSHLAADFAVDRVAFFLSHRASQQRGDGFDQMTTATPYQIWVLFAEP